MKLDKKSAFFPATAETVSLDPLLGFVLRNSSALWEAVRFVQGYEAARLVDKCVAHLERDGRLTRHTRMMLDQIHSILLLEHTDDPELPFMAFFAVVDPADPVVEEICLLCDRLGTAMEESARRERPSFGAPKEARTA